MNFRKKEKVLVDALRQNHSQFDSLGEALDFLLSRLMAFPQYVNSVIRMEIQTPIYRSRYEGDTLRYYLEKLDKDRRAAHEKAIMSCNQLNRLCQSLDLPPFADIDTSDRCQVADFAGVFVSEVYNGRSGRGISEIVTEQVKKETYLDEKDYDIDI